MGEKQTDALFFFLQIFFLFKLDVFGGSLTCLFV